MDRHCTRREIIALHCKQPTSSSAINVFDADVFVVIVVVVVIVILSGDFMDKLKQDSCEFVSVTPFMNFCLDNVTVFAY